MSCSYNIFTLFIRTIGLLAVFHTSVWAWSSDPSANLLVTPSLGEQQAPAAIADSTGGMIVTWQDSRGGTFDVYAQKINTGGSLVWNPEGVAITTAITAQTVPALISDDNDGAWITWQDAKNGDFDIYLNRILSGGSLIDSSAIQVNAEAGNQTSPVIISDDASGSIIVWQDDRDGGLDIYAQRMSTVPLWIASGIVVTDAAGSQTNFQAISDGTGGVIVVWQDNRGLNTDLYAQKLNSAGVAQWTVNGVLLVSAAGNQTNPRLVTDGAGGALIVWQDSRAGGSDIYVQHILSSGVIDPGWTTDGVAVSTAVLQQVNPDILSDGAGGALISWQDHRAANADIYAHRISAAGQLDPSNSWTVNGKPLTSNDKDQLQPKMVSDGLGGAVIAWQDLRDGNADIYASRVSNTGVSLWSGGAAAVSTASNAQSNMTLVAQSQGGVLLAWQDARGSNDDLFAQRVGANGGLSSITTPVPLSPTDNQWRGFPMSLRMSDFSDTKSILGQIPAITHSASQWQIAVDDVFTPDTEKLRFSVDDDYRLFHLAVKFPFDGRLITDISVNSNGLIELLEEGVSSTELGAFSTHSTGSHINSTDAIFAFNDDLDTSNGYVRVFEEDSFVTIEWFATTRQDNDIVNHPLKFQVTLFNDGLIQWNFDQKLNAQSSADLFSGVVPKGGLEITMPSPVTEKSSFVYNPSTLDITALDFIFEKPTILLNYDSGEVSELEKTNHVVSFADTKNIEEKESYYWRSRFKNSDGDWSSWSAPSSVKIDLTAPITTASIGGTSFTASEHYTLFCADELGDVALSGCEATYYTLDGSTPTTNSAIYFGPVEVPATQTLKFFSVDLAGNRNAVQSVSNDVTVAPASQGGGSLGIWVFALYPLMIVFFRRGVL